MRRSWDVATMIQRGMVVAIEVNRFCMKEQVAAAFLAAQQRRARPVAMILIVVLVIVMLTFL